MPPGVLINTDNVVVVDEHNQEVAAHVSSLAAWKAMPPRSLLCDGYQSGGNPGIRSVLVQFQSTFSANTPKIFRVLLNIPRQLDIADQIDVQSTLRQVNDGLYANHNLSYDIKEAKVLVTVEPKYLSCTNMTTLSGEVNKAPEMFNTDQAQHDFFYTAIQEFHGRNVTEYIFDIFNDDIKHAYWLYDRPQTFLNAYLRSGNIDQLRSGLQAADHFKQEIYTEQQCATTMLLPQYDCVGFFAIKNKEIGHPYKDSKYSYNESLVTAYLLTGNKTYLDIIPLPIVAVQKTVNFDHHGQPSQPGATERHKGNALLTTVMLYEFDHGPAMLLFINNAIDALDARQKQALDGTVVNGCFNYSPEQSPVESFSPWMSSLMANALLRTYQALGDERIPKMLVELARCEVDRGIYRTDAFISDHNNGAFANMLLPYYIASSYGEKRDIDGENPWSSVEHALDVAQPIALGAYFSTNSNQRAAFVEATQALLKTHDYRIRYWTRDFANRPLYRLAPPRKFNWQYKNTGSTSWVLEKIGTSDNTPPLIKDNDKLDDQMCFPIKTQTGNTAIVCL